MTKAEKRIAEIQTIGEIIDSIQSSVDYCEKYEISAYIGNDDEYHKLKVEQFQTQNEMRVKAIAALEKLAGI